ncbi:MAG: hypothetical protein ISS80_03175 [Candidatus Cloacimonetes bacterium]|nr:hypothetical protein [Candidatus Cloacimonadota bacterium]
MGKNKTSERTDAVLLRFNSVFSVFLVDKLNLSTQLHKQVQLAYEKISILKGKQNTT